MTVRELVLHLQKQPQDAPVGMIIDEHEAWVHGLFVGDDGALILTDDHIGVEHDATRRGI